MKPMLEGGLAALIAIALLLPKAATAQTTSFTATGWVNQVLSPGIVAINANGQVLLRGITHTWAAMGSDARITGQVLNIGGGAYNADGTANLQGAAYLQVGTWDPAHTNFTPTAGMWDVTWRGVLQTNNSFLSTFAGYGSGGTIDGLRLEGTLARGPAAGPIDPAVPYMLTGSIKPPPVSRTLVSVGFTNGAPGWTLWGVGTFSAATGQLVEQTSGAPGDMHLLRSPIQSWSLADGQTLECQADLVSLTETGLNYARLWVGNQDTAGYEFDLATGKAGLLKWDLVGGTHLTCFWFTNSAQLRTSNVVLYLALTRVGDSALITTRVLDKSNQNAVLLESTFTDTPGVDPSLTTDQFVNLSGITIFPMFSDSTPPLLSGTEAGVGMAQFVAGTAQTIWDNFSLRLHDEPPISVARAVQLTWPNPSGVNYMVEGAPTLLGPWQPIQDVQTPGLQKLALPIAGPMQFFRLQQAP